MWAAQLWQKKKKNIIYFGQYWYHDDLNTVIRRPWKIKLLKSEENCLLSDWISLNFNYNSAL